MADAGLEGISQRTLLLLTTRGCCSALGIHPASSAKAANAERGAHTVLLLLVITTLLPEFSAVPLLGVATSPLQVTHVNPALLNPDLNVRLGGFSYFTDSEYQHVLTNTSP